MAYRILIVDDASAIRFAASQYFTGLGYQVDAAEDLQGAEALLSRSSYNLVIADLSLTGTFGTQGLDLIGLVHERSPQTAVILLTAHGSRAIDAEARRRGAASVLCKAGGLRRVADEVQRLIGVPL